MKQTFLPIPIQVQNIWAKEANKLVACKDIKQLLKFRTISNYILKKYIVNFPSI